MKWLIWKFKQFKRWLTYRICLRYRWKKLWNSESDKAHWEILHDAENKTVRLHYIPNDDYSKDDTKIRMEYDQFEDLVKFINRIK